MNVFIVDAYYPAVLESIYARRPEMASWPYAAQWRGIMDECFGVADFYSRNLSRLGHAATEVVANGKEVQSAWAREHGTTLRGRWIFRRGGRLPIPRPARDWAAPVLLAQIREARPDVVHVQDPVAIDSDLLRAIRPLARVLTAQIASPHPRSSLRGYDLILSSLPNFVDAFRRAGLRSERWNLGFEPTVLPRLERGPARDVVFVGGMSRAHAERIRFFEDLARMRPFDWWGYGLEALDARSPLRPLHRGHAWGLAMYAKLADARIALNRHIDIAGPNANNMRLFEATGAGTLLLTDAKANLHELFVPDREVAAYESVEGCAEKIDHFLAHEEVRAAIARAGQERTLRDHTYERRMSEFVDIVRQLL